MKQNQGRVEWKPTPTRPFKRSRKLIDPLFDVESISVTGIMKREGPPIVSPPKHIKAKTHQGKNINKHEALAMKVRPKRPAYGPGQTAD